MAEETAQEATMTQEEHTAEVVAARKETMEKNRKARDVERRPPAAIKDEQMHHERDRADLAAAADALYPPIKPWSGRGAADFRRGVADAIAGKPPIENPPRLYRIGYDHARGKADAIAGKPEGASAVTPDTPAGSAEGLTVAPAFADDLRKMYQSGYDEGRGVADAIAGKPAADGASEFYRFGYDYARGFDDAGAGKPAAGRGASKEYRGGYRKGRALRDKRDNVNP